MTTVRVEPCICGGPPIASPSLKESGVHIAVHNVGPVHNAWRRAREATDQYDAILAAELYAESFSDRFSRPRPTAGNHPRDLSGSKSGASTGVEGAA